MRPRGWSRVRVIFSLFICFVDPELNTLDILNHGAQFRLRSRYFMNQEENITLVNCKKIICKIVLMVFDMKVDFATTEFIRHFRSRYLTWEQKAIKVEGEVGK